MDETETIIKEQIKILPEELKQFISQDKWSSDLSEISRKNNLSEEQRVSLTNEVVFVLLGMEYWGDFAKNISKELNIPEIVSRDITQEAEEKIFNEIKEWLPTGVEKESLPSDQLLEDAAGNADNIIDESETKEDELGIRNKELRDGQRQAEQLLQQTPASAKAMAGEQNGQARWMKSVVSEDKLATDNKQQERPTVTNNQQPTRTTFASQKLNGQAHQTPATQDLGGQASSTSSGQTKDEIEKMVEKPTAQEWGTVVDHRLSAQSEKIKNDNSWEARKARLVEEKSEDKISN